MPPPVLRNNSQLSRTTAMTGWTCATALTASTLTDPRVVAPIIRHDSNSTTRTPLAYSIVEEPAKIGSGQRRMSRERPQSAVLLPSMMVLPFADEHVENEKTAMTTSINGNGGSARTPRKLEKVNFWIFYFLSSKFKQKLNNKFFIFQLLSSFVQLRTTTPVTPLPYDSLSYQEAGKGHGPPAAGSRRNRLLQRATTEDALLGNKGKSESREVTENKQSLSCAHWFSYFSSFSVSLLLHFCHFLVSHAPIVEQFLKRFHKQQTLHAKLCHSMDSLLVPQRNMPSPSNSNKSCQTGDENIEMAIGRRRAKSELNLIKEDGKMESPHNSYFVRRILPSSWRKRPPVFLHREYMKQTTKIQLTNGAANRLSVCFLIFVEILSF